MWILPNLFCSARKRYMNDRFVVAPGIPGMQTDRFRFGSFGQRRSLSIYSKAILNIL
jgi:hypothetical protein